MKLIILAATVAILAAAGPALAQETKMTPAEKSTTATKTTVSPTTDSMGQYYTNSEATDFLASKIMNARVYATTKEVDTSANMDKVDTNWDDIGEVNNIVIGKDGTIKAVILGVGGFLSIGEKDVAVKMSELQFVKKSGANASDFYIVVKGNKDTLAKAPTWKMSAAE